MAVVGFLNPLIASSRPCSEAHAERVNGASASWCHTLGPCAPRDPDWRAVSEQVKTDLESLPL